MKQPVVQFMDGPEIPLTEAPNEALQAVIAGDLLDIETHEPTDSPAVCKIIAARILCERLSS